MVFYAMENASLAHFTSNSSLGVIIGPFILRNPSVESGGKMARLVVFPRDLVTSLPQVIKVLGKYNT
jgi:hypothetical protein